MYTVFHGISVCFLVIVATSFSVLSDEKVYNAGDYSIQPNAIELEVLEWINDVRVKQGKKQLTIDPAIISVLRRYSKDRRAEIKNARFDKDLLRELLWREGQTDYRIVPSAIGASGSVKKLLIRIKTALVEGFNQKLLADQYNIVAYGTILESDEIASAFSLMERKTTLGRFPRIVESGKSYRLSGTFADSYSTPVLFITTPFGTISRLEGTAAGSSFYFDFTFPKEQGRYMIEVLVKGKSGPTVANLFPIFLGSNPDYQPEDFEIETENQQVDCRGSACENIIADLLNQYRGKHKLTALSRQPDLDEVARLHSKDMADHQFFGHQSPRSGSIADRANAKGIAFSRATENLGKDKNIYSAFVGLLESPGHRMNILDRGVDKVGVGLASDGAENKYLTINFFKRIERSSGASLVNDIVNKINSKRASARIADLKLDDPLSTIAAEHAKLMRSSAQANSKIANNPTIEDRLKMIKATFRKTSILVAKTKDVDSLLGTKKVVDSEYNAIGLGIAEDTRESGLLWVTIIFARK